MDAGDTSTGPLKDRRDKKLHFDPTQPLRSGHKKAQCPGQKSESHIYKKDKNSQLKSAKADKLSVKLTSPLIDSCKKCKS
jgi:hypothetical protein